MPIMQTQIAHSNSPRLAELVGVPSFDIDIVWERALPFVQSALEHSFDTPEDVYAALKIKGAQLWLAWLNDGIEAICITRVEEYTNGKTCGIWICAGSGRNDWKHHMATIEAWAKSNGCIAMKHTARLGWQRVLKPMGYEATHIVLEKDL